MIRLYSRCIPKSIPFEFIFQSAKNERKRRTKGENFYKYEEVSQGKRNRVALIAHKGIIFLEKERKKKQIGAIIWYGCREYSYIHNKYTYMKYL
jgi:hypothetical protein